MRRVVSPVLALVGAACFALCLGFSYQAGCAVDLKTLSEGDPAAGLRLSAIGLYCGMAAIAAGALAIGFRGQGDESTRLGEATAFVVLGGLSLWWIAMQFEAAGTGTAFNEGHFFPGVCVPCTPPPTT